MAISEYIVENQIWKVPSSSICVGLTEDALWSKIPPEILTSILAYLPWDDLLRLRLTCKSWFFASQDPVFFKMFAEARKQAPICILSQSCGFDSLKSRKNSMRYNLLSRNPCAPDSMRLSENVHLSHQPWHITGAAAGSFILLNRILSPSVGTKDEYCHISCERERELVVVNPINGKARAIFLPDYLRKIWASDIRGMFTDESGNYSILASSEGSSFCVEHSDMFDEDGYACLAYHLYSSRTSSWQTMFSCHMTAGSYFEQPVYYQGRLHCLFVDQTISRNDFSCQVYYAGKQNWDKLAVQIPWSFLMFPCLFTYRGNLMLAAGISNLDGNERSVHIWQLDAYRGSWTEMCRMPESLLKEFHVKSPSNFYRTSHACKDFLCFSKFNTKYVDMKERGVLVSKVIMYNLSTNCWWSSPREDLIPESLFEPAFDLAP